MKKYILSISLLLLSTTQILACGGSSSEQASISVSSPQAGKAVFAGAIINFVVRTSNFDLVDPSAHAHTAFRDHGEIEEPQDHHEDEAATSDPDATEGHYHVYLDDAQGSDPHLTAWTHEGSYTLPTTIAVGEHSLRFELRNNHHIPVGTGGSEDLVIFSVE